MGSPGISTMDRYWLSARKDPMQAMSSKRQLVPCMNGATSARGSKVEGLNMNATLTLSPSGVGDRLCRPAGAGERERERDSNMADLSLDLDLDLEGERAILRVG